MGASRIVGLMAEDGLQDTASAPQIAALVLKQTPISAESGGQSGEPETLSNPTNAFEELDTHRPVPNLSAHYERMIEECLRLGSEVRAGVRATRREDTMRNHSVTPLLHHILKEMPGEQAQQKGRLVAPERLRVAFNHPHALTSEAVQQTGQLVSGGMRSGHRAQTEILPRQKALATRARHLFREKREEQACVVTIDHSKELCGETHCRATGQGEMGVIVQKTSIAVGIHRIEGLIGRAAEDNLMNRHQTVEALATKLQTSREMLAVLTEQQV